MQHDEITASTMSWLDGLVSEIQATIDTQVLPGWGGQNHGLPRTLYGYVMSCFAQLDLLSQYRESPGAETNQTSRMVDFLVESVGYGRLQCEVAVRIWRHSLMHTGRPREIVGRPSGHRYKWLLHWGAEHLPRAQHMQFQAQEDPRILNVGLIFLAQDLKTGATRFMEDVGRSRELAIQLHETAEALRIPREFVEPED